jgi:hypothetical protein
MGRAILSDQLPEPFWTHFIVLRLLFGGKFLQSGNDNVVVSAQIGSRNGNRTYYSNSADYDRKRPWIEPVTWIMDLTNINLKKGSKFG